MVAAFSMHLNKDPWHQGQWEFNKLSKEIVRQSIKAFHLSYKKLPKKSDKISKFPIP